jgi:hypothetical protein
MAHFFAADRKKNRVRKTRAKMRFFIFGLKARRDKNRMS